MREMGFTRAEIDGVFPDMVKGRYEDGLEAFSFDLSIAAIRTRIKVNAIGAGYQR